MNKVELVAKVAEETGMSKAEADKAVDATFNAITASLKAGEAVRLLGFATLSVGSRAERTGKNPKTGEKITIPAKKGLKVKAGKALIEALNA
jgi:DNA-binding protein HU-beta